MTITRESLLEHGYKPFQQRNLKEFTNSFYQKLFRDSIGKRFYLTLACYDNKDIQQRYPDSNTPDFSYEPDAQFTDANGTTFNVEMLSPKSVKEMEAFFLKMWLVMGCEYYERYCEDAL